MTQIYLTTVILLWVNTTDGPQHNFGIFLSEQRLMGQLIALPMFVTQPVQPKQLGGMMLDTCMSALMPNVPELNLIGLTR